MEIAGLVLEVRNVHREHLTIEKLADLVGLSRSYLNNLIRIHGNSKLKVAVF